MTKSAAPQSPPAVPAPRGSLDKRSLVSAALVGAAVARYLVERRHNSSASGVPSAASEGDRSKYLWGLLLSLFAVFGHDGTIALRKSVASLEAIGHAEQVAVTALTQGLVALLCLIWRSEADLGLQSVPWHFWLFAMASSSMNAGIKTMETRALAMGEMTLCMPFLAFDPVSQLVFALLVSPVTCHLFGWFCDESKQFTARHALAVAAIVQGVFSLAAAASAQELPSMAPQSTCCQHLPCDFTGGARGHHWRAIYCKSSGSQSASEGRLADHAQLFPVFGDRSPGQGGCPGRRQHVLLCLESLAHWFELPLWNCCVSDAGSGRRSEERHCRALLCFATACGLLALGLHLLFRSLLHAFVVQSRGADFPSLRLRSEARRRGADVRHPGCHRLR
eukprot:TRINITY_DN75259_c0_g1_i1.p1 TRINITY_DN75259_c0_g1~~TRINITY_DN75259_c0_g1_i1.p1  ORF type:complete len:392 (+),score=42.77 TRINITY_DN75259_c0_g1_i1:93-1268(+)